MTEMFFLIDKLQKTYLTDLYPYLGVRKTLKSCIFLIFDTLFFFKI